MCRIERRKQKAAVDDSGFGAVKVDFWCGSELSTKLESWLRAKARARTMATIWP